MPSEVRLSETADADLVQVSEFTHTKFGHEQALKYRDGLLRAIRLLAGFPMLGTDQGRLRKGLRRVIHASHAIYYWLDGEVVVVDRILGPGQDPLREFEK